MRSNDVPARNRRCTRVCRKVCGCTCRPRSPARSKSRRHSFQTKLVDTARCGARGLGKRYVPPAGSPAACAATNARQHGVRNTVRGRAFFSTVQRVVGTAAAGGGGGRRSRTRPPMRRPVVRKSSTTSRSRVLAAAARIARTSPGENPSAGSSAAAGGGGQCRSSPRTRACSRRCRPASWASCSEEPQLPRGGGGAPTTRGLVRGTGIPGLRRPSRARPACSRASHRSCRRTCAAPTRRPSSDAS